MIFYYSSSNRLRQYFTKDQIVLPYVTIPPHQRPLSLRTTTGDSQNNFQPKLIKSGPFSMNSCQQEPLLKTRVKYGPGGAVGQERRLSCVAEDIQGHLRQWTDMKPPPPPRFRTMAHGRRELHFPLSKTEQQSSECGPCPVKQGHFRLPVYFP